MGFKTRLRFQIMVSNLGYGFQVVLGFQKFYFKTEIGFSRWVSSQGFKTSLGLV